MIAVRLTEIIDRVCLSSICTQWRSASKSVAHNLPTQLPWLLLPNHKRDPGGIAATRRFFSLSHNRIFTIPLPESPGARANKAYPAPFGRIIAPQGIETLALLNPLTGTSVTLPQLPLTQWRRKNGGAFVLRNAKVFASNLVAVLFPDRRDLLFCRPGDSSWKRLDMTFCNPDGGFVYYKGKLFIVDSTQRAICVFDVDTLRRVSTIPLVGFENRRSRMVFNYLVESVAGDLLLVQRTPGDENMIFRLFQLDESEENENWMEINSMGDNVLFVDGVQAMALDATTSIGWRGNCIYFVDRLPSKHRKGLMVFNVGEGRIEELPLFSYASSNHWGKAMWVVPTLC